MFIQIYYNIGLSFYMSSPINFTLSITDYIWQTNNSMLLYQSERRKKNIMDSFISNEKYDNVRNNYLRNKVKLYNGYKITSNVLRQISYIESRAVLVRNNVDMTYCNINTLYELCDLHNSEPENEFLILGDDWYISYTELPDLCAIEINDWISISNNENTFLQTIEMISTFKQLFLGYEDCLIYARLRHSTSYNFYKFI